MQILLFPTGCLPSINFYTSLKELSLCSCLDALLKHCVILLLMLIERAGASSHPRNWAIKRIESMALDLCPNEEESNAKSAGTESPEQAAEGCCYEGTYTLLVAVKE